VVHRRRQQELRREQNTVRAEHLEALYQEVCLMTIQVLLLKVPEIPNVAAATRVLMRFILTRLSLHLIQYYPPQ